MPSTPPSTPPTILPSIKHGTTHTLLIDTFNLIRRIHAANPDAERDIQAVIESSRRSLARALATHRPTHAISILDSHEITWRHQLEPSYKGDRAPPPAALMANLDEFSRVFAELGARSLLVPHFEADDVIATLAVGIAASGGQVTILSTDKGFLPLLSPAISSSTATDNGGPTPGINVYNHFDQHAVTAADAITKFDLRVDQLRDYWAMAGDPTNNIKGVLRVGKKTAVTLLKTHGSLDAILVADAADAVVARVQAQAAQALRCRELVTLRTDIEIGANLKAFRI
ncbi:MAG: protein Xni [Candidatus Paceibacteria bacterium]|jgi:protein Xni